jgi:hypothetical protein
MTVKRVLPDISKDGEFQILKISATNQLDVGESMDHTSTAQCVNLHVA